MFEYENLYNTKTFGKNVSYKKMEILAMRLVPKVKGDPPGIHTVSTTIFKVAVLFSLLHYLVW